MGKKGLMTNAFKEEWAKELGIWDVVQSEGWGGIRTKDAGNIFLEKKCGESGTKLVLANNFPKKELEINCFQALFCGSTHRNFFRTIQKKDFCLSLLLFYIINEEISVFAIEYRRKNS